MDTFFDNWLPPFLQGLLIAAGAGLILGLEREFNTHAQPGHLGGVRTFILSTLLGYIAGWLGANGYVWAPVVFAAGFFLLIGIAYFVQAGQGNMGITTETALMLALGLGLLIAAGQVQEAMSLVVSLALVLSFKEQLHSFIRRITAEELSAFIKFAALALLLLPLLPDEGIGPEGIINLRELGWIVVLVLSLSFSGYLMLKFGGAQQGVWLTALIGGLFSSTLIAWVFSARSREARALAPIFGAGIVLASSVMFVRVFILTLVFAPVLATQLAIPLALMLVASLAPTVKLWRQAPGSEGSPTIDPGQPLDIRNALWFSLLYIGISYGMYSARQWLNETLIYLSGAIAGIADIDAITISTAKWAASQPEAAPQAAIIVLLALISNSVFKLAVSWLNGARELRSAVALGFGLVLAVGAIACGWMIWRS
jgi:uncharacterized membrane protein (DUF4010 family)